MATDPYVKKYTSDEEKKWLKVDASPWDKVSADDTYQARRFSDEDGYTRGCGAYTDCDSGLRNKLADEHQASIRHLGDLIDDQADQPAGKLLGGGGPVSHNEDDPDNSSWRGSGRKGPRYKNPPPASYQGNQKGWKK